MGKQNTSDALMTLDKVLEGDASRLAGLEKIIETMNGPAPDRDAPVREIPARLGDRWSALILMILQTGTYRHAELKRVVTLLAHEESISQRMLTLRLRMLERDGLVCRSVYPTVPPSVDYALSPLGEELAFRFFDLVFWIQERDADIMAARAQFDAAQST